MQFYIKERQLQKAYIARSIWNTSSFLIASLFTKVINFTFNMLLLRVVNKETFGLAKIYLEFIFHILLFFPRETMRRCCQKYSASSNNEEEHYKFVESAQLNWLFITILTLLCFPLLLTFIFFAETLKAYKIHLACYVGSALLELTMEPVILYMNLKLENKHKLFALTLPNYVRVISNYFLAVFFNMDIWSFTLSRILSSLLFFCYLFYIGCFKYQLGTEVLLPNFKKFLIFKDELKEIFFSFFQNSLLKLVLTNTEKTFLSFYSIFSEENKAEYSFVLENFHILAKFLLEPVEDNFFNLISKLKTYKNVSCYDRERNNNEKNKGKPDYDDKLKILQASIRLMLIFFSLMISYITVIGKETIIVLYTKTWASESTVRLTKLYSLYLGLLAINGIIEAYANAIICEKMMNYFRKSLVVNSVLLVIFSFYFTQFDISGLILANCICLTMRIIFSLYLILVKNDDEDKLSGSSLLQNIYKIIKFLYFCLYKSLSLLSIIMCLIILKSAKSVVFLQECLPLLLLIAGIVIFINCYIVFSLEKKKFSEVFKMKDAEIII
jgi:oligosaccharide translocation protein RFT1